MRNWFIGLAVLGIFGSGSAAALSADGEEGFYLGAFGSYELSDANRDSDDGYGFQVTLGRTIGIGESLELSFLGVRRDRNIDGRPDYKNSLILDYVRDFGLFKFQSEALPTFKPYVLAGLGAVLEDVQGREKVHPAVNLGAGVLVPLRFGSWDWGWGLRAEAKALGQFNDRDSAPANRQFLADYHFQIGLQIPLNFHPGRKPVLPAVPDCGLSVVDPVTGRADCLADSDRDGVQDGTDQCPDTASGVKVNDVGCPVETGGDADSDGVLDSDDQCPGTAQGLTVDAKGCAIEQTLTLQSVTFETGSAVLTGQATAVLDGFARAVNGQKNLKLEIGGHTDNTGTAAFNMLLSEQRAKAVKQYLVSKGVDPAVLTTKGYGQTEPVASNDDDAGRAVNRRVDFKIVLE